MIVESLREALSNDYNVLLAYLFGSRVRDFQTALSDVDIAVMLRESSFDRIADLQYRVAKKLGVSEDRVDVVDLSKAPTSLKYVVLKEGVKILDREDYGKKLAREALSFYPEIHFLTMDNLYELADSQDPMSLNADLINRRIVALKEEVRYLKTRLLTKPLDNIIGNDDLRRAFERSVEISVEAMLDVCKHVVAALGLGVAETYSDYVRNLLAKDIMPHELGESLLKLVRWRNIIVHRYLEIDYTKLYKDASSLVREVAPRFVKWALELVTKSASYG